jgi:hypothetical protein
MDPQLRFGLSIALSFVVWALGAKYYFWQALRIQPGREGFLEIGLLLLWSFNLWGTADLLFAFYQGLIGVGVEPGLLGAMYFVPTVAVPLLIVTHVLAFRMLLAARQPAI